MKIELVSVEDDGVLSYDNSSYVNVLNVGLMIYDYHSGVSTQKEIKRHILESLFKEEFGVDIESLKEHNPEIFI